MGGTITVIVREKKDKIHKMHRWTNSFPFYIKSLKFIEKDPAHLKEYMHQWVLMKKDYEKNK